MIRALRIVDSDQFVDILNDAFTRELHHIGERYGYDKMETTLVYFLSRILQLFYGDIKDLPQILAYYDSRGSVLGISKIIPTNARKDHWFSEMTAVKKDVQQRGIGTALKEYTVQTYGKKARRLFANVREDNPRMIGINQRVGYVSYSKKSLFTLSPSSSQKCTVSLPHNVRLRPFKKDQNAVYDLYVQRTPGHIRKIEEKTPEDYMYGTIMKLQVLFRQLMGFHDKKYVIVVDGKVCCFLWFESLWSLYENLHILMDSQQSGLSQQVISAIQYISPDSHIISYVPHFRDLEQRTLVEAGFEEKDVYINMVLQCGR
jgi:ribosomal protein S18 acetylase RimI-like enzyme